MSNFKMLFVLFLGAGIFVNYFSEANAQPAVYASGNLRLADSDFGLTAYETNWTGSGTTLSWDLNHVLGHAPLTPGILTSIGSLSSTSGGANISIANNSNFTWNQALNPGAGRPTLSNTTSLSLYVLGPTGTAYIIYGTGTQGTSYTNWSNGQIGKGALGVGGPNEVPEVNQNTQSSSQVIKVQGTTTSFGSITYNGNVYRPVEGISGLSSFIHNLTNPAATHIGTYTGNLNLALVVGRVGSPFTREPGGNDDPSSCYGSSANGSTDYGSSGSGAGGTSCSLSHRTRNFHCTFNDPVATRTLPLVNNIHVNSQVVETARAMGNATFSYDIHVSQATIYNSAGVGSTHWVLVDGDGQRFDFGPVTGAPARPPRAYSTLTQSFGGYTLTNAGPPGQIEKAGNFVYTFNSSGNLVQISDPYGNTQSLAYTSGALTQVTDDASGKQIAFGYSGSRITSVTDNGSGSVTTLGYTSNRLTSIVLAANSITAYQISFSYSPDGDLLTVTKDGDLNTTIHLSYDWVPSRNKSAFVPLATVTTIQGSSQIVTSESTWSGAVVKSDVTNADSGTVTYHFDVNGNIVHLILPPFAGGTGSLTYDFSYDTAGALSQVSDGTRTELFTNNTYGLVTSHTDGINRTTNYTYNGVNLTHISDSEGSIVDIDYNDSAHPNIPTEVMDGANHSWTFELNSYGQILTITPPPSSPTGPTIYTYEEDSQSPAYGYLRSQINGAGDLTTYGSYSALGDPTQVSTYSDAQNPSTQSTYVLQYDAGRRLTNVEHPDSADFTLTYSGRNLSATRDEGGTVYEHTMHPCCDLPSQISGPLSWILKWQRDRDGKVTKFTDARNYESNYSFGNNGELTQITYPDSSSLSYLYDNFGRVRRITNGRNQQKNFTYNNADELTAIAYPGSGNSESFSYRGDGLLSDASDGRGTRTYAFNSARLLESITYNFGASGLSALQKIEYTYNPDHTIATMLWKNGGSTVASWSYGYDGAGRMTSATGPDGTVNYVYDGEGKLLTQTNPNSTKTTYGYNDDRGWVTSISHALSNTPFESYTLEYDGNANTVGNITHISELNGTNVSYGYDALYRLTSENRSGSTLYDRTYGYDLAGNLLTLGGNAQTFTFGAYDNANKFTSVPGGYATYDADGNLTHISGTYILPDEYSGSPSGDYQFVPASLFTWDENSKLVQHVILGNITNFGYDSEGKRVWSQIGSGPKKFFIFDGDQLIGEIQNGSPTVAYTWGADGISSERLMGSSNESLYYHYGPQGETRFLTNSSGAVANSYRYNAWGRLLTGTGTKYNHHLYGGKYGYYSDGGSMGLMLAGQRWYSSYVMKWLSRDPIGYEGGENLYE